MNWDLIDWWRSACMFGSTVQLFAYLALPGTRSTWPGQPIHIHWAVGPKIENLRVCWFDNWWFDMNGDRWTQLTLFSTLRQFACDLTDSHWEPKIEEEGAAAAASRLNGKWGVAKWRHAMRQVRRRGWTKVSSRLCCENPDKNKPRKLIPFEIWKRSGHVRVVALSPAIDPCNFSLSSLAHGGKQMYTLSAMQLHVQNYTI